jgi:hypothetical protein
VLPWGHFPLLRVDGGLEKGGQNLSNSISLQWYVCAEEAPELIPKVREHSEQRCFLSSYFSAPGSAGSALGSLRCADY